MPRVVARVRREPAQSRALAFRPSTSVAPAASPDWSGYQTDPYVDYGRVLTPAGGILIAYKDLDERWRHAAWRVFAWWLSTGFEGWLLFFHAPAQSDWIKLACLFAMMAVNFFIVAKPVEIYRRAEFRPDCMILEGHEVFWLRMMENGWPAFRPDGENNQVLCGVYGTRFVEYLTARRFDEEDRMPEVFAAHVQEAMERLWAPALGLGAVQAPGRQHR